MEESAAQKDRIVVGVDGSHAGRAAILWSLRLARVLDAEIVAVHAVGLLEGAHRGGDPAGTWRSGVRDVVEHLWCVPLADAAVDHRIEVVDGDAVDVLLTAVGREQAALVVLGARGLAGRPELALGSTSLRVLQASPVPALVVPGPGTAGPDEGPLRHLLVGVDGSRPSRAALALAAEIAGLAGGELTVVEATQAGAPRVPDPSAALEDLVAGIRSEGIGAQVIVRSGEPAATLLAVADDVDADLVVVGTRARGDPADPLVGSVARQVAADGHRPTLVVPVGA